MAANNSYWQPHVGKVVVVVAHSKKHPPETMAHQIEFVDGTTISTIGDRPAKLYSRPPDIIPIGHDPDAETRNVEREVEA